MVGRVRSVWAHREGDEEDQLKSSAEVRWGDQLVARCKGEVAEESDLLSIASNCGYNCSENGRIELDGLEHIAIGKGRRTGSAILHNNNSIYL
jgi:hypothetical protein